MNNAPDVKALVARQRGEDIQIHDAFGALESADAVEKAKIKKNRDLQAMLQFHTSPDVKETSAQKRSQLERDLKSQVARQRGEDIQLHDGFGVLESADATEQSKIWSNRDLQALLQTDTSPDVKALVARQRGEDIQIHDGFGALESADAVEKEKIKKNRDLQALMQMRTSPDVKELVARQRGEDIQIHDGFGALETKDRVDEEKLKHSKDLHALMQTSGTPHTWGW